MSSNTFDFADAATPAQGTPALQLTPTGLEGLSGVCKGSSLENGGTTIDPNIWFIPDNLFQQNSGSNLGWNWEGYFPQTPNVYRPPSPFPFPPNSRGEEHVFSSKKATNSLVDIEASRGTHTAEHGGASGSNGVLYSDANVFGCDVRLGHFPTNKTTVSPEELQRSLNQRMDDLHHGYSANQIYPNPWMTSPGYPTIPPFQEALNQIFLGGYPDPHLSLQLYSEQPEEGKTDNKNTFDHEDRQEGQASGTSPVEQSTVAGGEVAKLA
ncbi:hypothetical protein JR316_0009378 [Psilocybe cubensis]|uniref:Uncharacterized protein n=1 Tax=Psilocybe cubensis TaxID=181762 RepID=A0ACB8GUM4_PSICU|nr:hypothetical protein JR316_0009378 [Psilocybe cubensis]KAH9478916.1 hypothetical protein JR316_0009378 [Psilocybe cubensis]